MTSQYACYGLWGPRAREILQPLTTADLSSEAFPYMRAQELAIGPVPCLALRVTYVGELGWELYCPTEFGLRLWDTLWVAGQQHGLVAAGYKAIDSLRLEKGYRVWGSDITPEDSPFEAGLGFAVKLDKDDFIGRDALVQAGEPEPHAPVPDARGSTRGGTRVGAGARRRRARRACDERRLRVHGRAIDRVRVRSRRARGGYRGRGRDLRQLGLRRDRCASRCSIRGVREIRS